MKDKFIDNIIREKKIIVFDLEGYTKADGKDARVRQYSFQRLGEDKEPILVSCGSDLPYEMLEPLFPLFKDAQLIVGHNFEQHDRRVLTEIMERSNQGRKSSKIIPEDKIWDTMKIEFLINSDINRKSFALNTSHHAKDDVYTVSNLFFNQLKRIKLLDEVNNYWDALSKKAQELIRTIIASPSPESPLSESDCLFEEVDSPISEYLYNDGSIDKELQLNAQIVLVAPIRLWGTIAVIARKNGKSVSFYSESSDESYLSLRISDTSSLGLDKWFNCVMQQYHDNSQYEYVVELPEYLQAYIKQNIAENRHEPSLDVDIVCARPKEDGKYSNEFKKIISKSTVVYIGLKSSSVFKSISELNNNVKHLLPGSNQIVTHFPKLKSVELSAMDKYNKSNKMPPIRVILDIWRDRKVDLISDLNQLYPGYTPVIVIQSRDREKKLYDEITQACNREYCGYYKTKAARRLQIATNNYGIASITMDEFLFFNKRIDGQFLLIFDNFDIGESEFAYYELIIPITANRWFTKPKVLILDTLYIQRKRKIEILEL